MVDLIQHGGTHEDLNQYWRTLKNELNRQKVLIDRLLLAGRLESGMMRLDNTLLDLVSVLEESILAVKPIADRRHIPIKLSARQDSPCIMGDKSGLQQVFINLLNNAVKFSPKGGEVKICVESTNELAYVSIIDHGLGIPTEDIPYLFQRFYRAKNVTIAEIPGSGVGLYIVKSIVEELGGNIDVESIQGVGTTFKVTLKRARPLQEM
jgi:two-component system phosphate regulon sensor histidine kinase PhoR